MIFIGFLLVVAVAVFVGVVLSDNWGGTTYPIHGFGHILGHLNRAEIFLSGVALTAIFFVGVWLISVSSRMRRRASKSRRAENRAGRQEREDLIAERDRLNQELESERAERAVAAVPVAAAVPIVANPAVVAPGTQPMPVAAQPAPPYSQPAYTQPAYTQPAYTQPTYTESQGTQPQVVTLPDDQGIMGGASASPVAGESYGDRLIDAPTTPVDPLYGDRVAADEARRHTV